MATKRVPLISVGIPVYNGEQFLERAINSLQRQDYPNFEIVISDNCSTDTTPEICRRLAAGDERIQYHRNRENIGAVKNFVKVFELSRGEYFMWAAHDDLWDPRCLSYLEKELSEWPEAGLAHSGVALLDDTGQLLAENAFPEDDNPNHWSCLDAALRCVSPARGRPKLNFAMYGLFRSAVLRETIPYVRDTAMWDRLFVVLMAMVAPFRYRPEPLYKRTLQDTRADERYLDDAYSRQVRASQWWRIRVIRDLVGMLWSCPAVPWARKLASPKVIWHFALNQWRKKKDPARKRRRVLEFKEKGVFKKSKVKRS